MNDNEKISITCCEKFDFSLYILLQSKPCNMSDVLLQDVKSYKIYRVISNFLVNKFKFKCYHVHSCNYRFYCSPEYIAR